MKVYEMQPNVSKAYMYGVSLSVIFSKITNIFIKVLEVRDI